MIARNSRAIRLQFARNSGRVEESQGYNSSDNSHVHDQQPTAPEMQMIMGYGRVHNHDQLGQKAEGKTQSNNQKSKQQTSESQFTAAI